MQKFIHFKKWIKCPHLTQESRYAWENECSGCESIIFLKKKLLTTKHQLGLTQYSLRSKTIYISKAFYN